MLNEGINGQFYNVAGMAFDEIIEIDVANKIGIVRQRVEGKYKIPVKARGKNIFDYNYYFENIEATTEAIGGTKFQLKPNTTYTVSTNIEFNKYANAFVKTTNTMPSTTQNGIYDTHPLTIKTGSNNVFTRI